VAKKTITKKAQRVLLVENLNAASRLLTKSLHAARKLDFPEKNIRAFQQINNALVRVDAAIEEIAV